MIDGGLQLEQSALFTQAIWTKVAGISVCYKHLGWTRSDDPAIHCYYSVHFNGLE